MAKPFQHELKVIQGQAEMLRALRMEKDALTKSLRDAELSGSDSVVVPPVFHSGPDPDETDGPRQEPMNGGQQAEGESGEGIGEAISLGEARKTVKELRKKMSCISKSMLSTVDIKLHECLAKLSRLVPARVPPGGVDPGVDPSVDPSADPRVDSGLKQDVRELIDAAMSELLRLPSSLDVEALGARAWLLGRAEADALVQLCNKCLARVGEPAVAAPPRDQVPHTPQEVRREMGTEEGRQRLVVRLIQEQRKESSATRKELKEEEEQDLEDGCESGDLTVSLKCPLSLSRIKVPTRTRHCTHLECFDLLAYLGTNLTYDTRNRRAWKCPNCWKSAQWNELLYDCYMSEILEATKCDSVIVAPNGDWSEAEELETAQPQDVMDLDSDDEGQQTARPQDVVDLDSDSDEEQDPPEQDNPHDAGPPGRSRPEAYGRTEGGREADEAAQGRACGPSASFLGQNQCQAIAEGGACTCPRGSQPELQERHVSIGEGVNGNGGIGEVNQRIEQGGEGTAGERGGAHGVLRQDWVWDRGSFFVLRSGAGTGAELTSGEGTAANPCVLDSDEEESTEKETVEVPDIRAPEHQVSDSDSDLEVLSPHGAPASRQHDSTRGSFELRGNSRPGGSPLVEAQPCGFDAAPGSADPERHSGEAGRHSGEAGRHSGEAVAPAKRQKLLEHEQWDPNPFGPVPRAEERLRQRSIARQGHAGRPPVGLEAQAHPLPPAHNCQSGSVPVLQRVSHPSGRVPSPSGSAQRERHKPALGSHLPVGESVPGCQHSTPCGGSGLAGASLGSTAEGQCAASVAVPCDSRPDRRHASAAVVQPGSRPGGGAAASEGTPPGSRRLWSESHLRRTNREHGAAELHGRGEQCTEDAAGLTCSQAHARAGPSKGAPAPSCRSGDAKDYVASSRVAAADGLGVPSRRDSLDGFDFSRPPPGLEPLLWGGVRPGRELRARNNGSSCASGAQVTRPSSSSGPQGKWMPSEGPEVGRGNTRTGRGRGVHSSSGHVPTREEQVFAGIGEIRTLNTDVPRGRGDAPKSRAGGTTTSIEVPTRRGDDPKSRTDGTTTRVDADASEGGGNQSKADGMATETDDPAGREDGPKSRSDGKATREHAHTGTGDSPVGMAVGRRPGTSPGRQKEAGQPLLAEALQAGTRTPRATAEACRTGEQAPPGACCQAVTTPSSEMSTKRPTGTPREVGRKGVAESRDGLSGDGMHIRRGEHSGGALTRTSSCRMVPKASSLASTESGSSFKAVVMMRQSSEKLPCGQTRLAGALPKEAGNRSNEFSGYELQWQLKSCDVNQACMGCPAGNGSRSGCQMPGEQGLGKSMLVGDRKRAALEAAAASVGPLAEVVDGQLIINCTPPRLHAKDTSLLLEVGGGST